MIDELVRAMRDAVQNSEDPDACTGVAMPVDCSPYNGVEMHVTRIARLEAAQEITDFNRGGTRYPRIRYGEENEDWGAERGELCHDCGARVGQYHALGCDVERCPICDEQALCCEHDWFSSYHVIDTIEIHCRPNQPNELYERCGAEGLLAILDPLEVSEIPFAAGTLLRICRPDGNTLECATTAVLHPHGVVGVFFPTLKMGDIPRLSVLELTAVPGSK